MDIEKLIERLYKHHTDWGEGRTQDFFEVCLDCKDAATALSTLQTENEKLRAELENYRKGHCSEGGCAAEKDRDAVLAELEQVKKKNKYSAHDVALILSDAFGDSCACNFNGNDEWLPEKCELLDTCPDVVGVACWEQYLKWRGQKEE